MRQVCNVSYAVQAEAFSEENDFLEWDAKLPLAPGEKARPVRAPRPADTKLLDQVGFGGVGNV